MPPSAYSQPKFLVSVTDVYDFKGEPVPILTTIFVSRFYDKDPLIAKDDVAAACFVPLADINMSRVYFATVRLGIEYLQKQGIPYFLPAK